MDKNSKKREALHTKRMRIRKTVSGTASRPRLSVYRSEKHIAVQLIDDDQGKTLMAVSTVGKKVAAQFADIKPIEAAKLIGEKIAEAAIKAGITKVVFDRGGRRYAGRVAALAEGARGKGLSF